MNGREVSGNATAGPVLVVAAYKYYRRDDITFISMLKPGQQTKKQDSPVSSHQSPSPACGKSALHSTCYYLKLLFWAGFASLKFPRQTQKRSSKLHSYYTLRSYSFHVKLIWVLIKFNGLEFRIQPKTNNRFILH